MKFRISLIVITLCMQNLHAQQWYKEVDKATPTSVKQGIELKDHGLLVPICLDSKPFSSFFYKLDANGNLLWKLYFGDTTAIIKLIKTQDNGYLAGGFTYRFDSPKSFGHALVIKLDSCFKAEWCTIFKNPDPSTYFIFGLEQHSDGDYLINCQTGGNKPNIVYCLDKFGKEKWEFCNLTSVSHIQETSSGDILITGDSYLEDTIPYLEILRPVITKINSEGKMIWESADKNVIGSATSSFQSQNGTITSFGGDKTFSKKKNCAVTFSSYNAEGKQIFRTFIGDTNYFQEGPSIPAVQVNDTTFIVVNITATEKMPWGAGQLDLIKVTSTGKILKTKYFLNEPYFVCRNIEKISTGKYLLTIAAKHTYSGSVFTVLMKINDDLELDTFTSTKYNYDLPCGDTSKLIKLVYPKPHIIYVDTTVPKGPFFSISQQQRVNETVKLYPNPIQNVLNIEFVIPCQNASYIISDLLGRQVLGGVLTGIKTTSINLQGLKQGLYMLNITQNNKPVIREKIIKN